MENTQPPAWKLMKPRPTQLRPQARLGLGPPRIFYRPCLDCSSASARPRLLRYSPTATVLTPCSPSPTALRHSLIRFHFSSSRCVPLAHSALQYRYSPCPMGGPRRKIKILSPPATIDARLRCQTTATSWSIRIPLQSRPFSHNRGSLNDGSHRTVTLNGLQPRHAPWVRN